MLFMNWNFYRKMKKVDLSAWGGVCPLCRSPLWRTQTDTHALSIVQADCWTLYSNSRNSPAIKNKEIETMGQTACMCGCAHQSVTATTTKKSITNSQKYNWNINPLDGINTSKIQKHTTSFKWKPIERSTIAKKSAVFGKTFGFCSMNTGFSNKQKIETNIDSSKPVIVDVVSDTWSCATLKLKPLLIIK